ncbi:hypothetical protein [Methylobacterium sp. J-067]|uniref:hypothetical protein n=1 Tax=Methylobacterium sp. J-067 TaxID=2836648 RepID=UPI001FBBC3C5|nr:hypothetical protein [Methylobacterium sp. J-067]MCJ2024713.1 hypothetical protein [Methylobacterium sp. J-067]
MIATAVRGDFNGTDLMRDPDERTSRWIGVGAFFLGAVLCNGALPADMLPINCALFAVDSALITAWLLLRAIKCGDGSR